MRALLLIFALVLASCAPPPSTVEGSGDAGGRLNPTQACEAKGGTYRPVCLMGELTCVMPHKDAGKACTDGDQCEGKQCRYSGDAKPGDSVTGACVRSSDPCGCFGLVKDGKSQGVLCVD